MALWKVEPTFKKSLVETIYYHKDGKTISEETGWRWGEFTYETEGDEPPTIEDGDDLFSCDAELQDWSTSDGCWTEYEFVGFSEEEEETMRNWLEENSFFELEEDGWVCGDSEMVITCDPTIERVDE